MANIFAYNIFIQAWQRGFSDGPIDNKSALIQVMA